MRPARPLRWATRAPLNSIANTAASLANLRCEMFERFFPQALRDSNRSVASESEFYAWARFLISLASRTQWGTPSLRQAQGRLFVKTQRNRARGVLVTLRMVQLVRWTAEGVRTNPAR